MHRYLNTTHRNAAWFKKAADSGDLVVQPPYQRNPIWSDRQKSSLIDTILLEYPIPEIYMQDVTDADGNQKHLLVDGQQRIRALLAFIEGEFELEDESPRWAGLKFDDLATEDRKRIFEYSFVVRLLPEMPDEEIRTIFQRINKNAAILNSQELRHATYWGPFIKLMEEIAEHDFWTTAALFSSNDRRRMLDIEFISELAVAVLNGLQNKKKKLEEFYQQYETRFEEGSRLRTLFVDVLGEVEQILPDISRTRWRKKSDFYTLFVNLAKHADQLPLAREQRSLAAEHLRAFARDVDMLLRDQGDAANQHVRDYAQYVERAASDLGARRERDRILDELLSPVFDHAAVAA